MKPDLHLLGATALMSCLFCNAVAAQTSSMSGISSKMTGVVVDLARTETGAPVQKQQKTILRDLDELIASLEKECEACRGKRKRNDPRTGMPDSFISGGTGGIGSLVDPKESEKDWAKLSTRERDRILQSMSEGFPPEYRTVLERYYRRLAEEKPAQAVGDRPQPKEAGSPTDKDQDKP